MQKVPLITPLKSLLVLVASFIGYIVGWILGATLAGNYAVSWQFAGQTGYETGGLFGGLILSALASVTTLRSLDRVGFRNTFPLLGTLLACGMVLFCVWNFSDTMMPPLFILLVLLPGAGAYGGYLMISGGC